MDVEKSDRAQAALRGSLVAAIGTLAVLFVPIAWGFAPEGVVASAGCVAALVIVKAVRSINRRDDPRFSPPPPDLP